MPPAIELTKDIADQIALTARVQLRISQDYKHPRLAQIKESEDLYNGVVPKTLRNPFNESFPFMSGFVDHLLSEIDDPPTVEFTHQDLADLKVARRVTAAFAAEVVSTMPEAMWAYKDRVGKKLAIFSGRCTYKYFAESPEIEGKPSYRSVFKVIDYTDFHCEPGGGGILEEHLFCGEENIYKTKQEIEDNAAAGIYDPMQVQELLSATGESDYKDTMTQYTEYLNRHTSLGLNPATQNYVGQHLFRCVEWYLTYKGVRYYCLFEERSGKWLRVKPLVELFESNMYPYKSWATHEDLRVFWSKAPCDDARPVARTINRVLNQELYNREKRNNGQRLYDPDMIYDLEAFIDTRPDGVVPVDTKGGQRALSSAMMNVQYGEINGSIDLVQFLDSYSGQKTASTPSSQGQAEKDKKVGIFFGELKQIEKRIGVLNRSYREAWAQIGYGFLCGLDENLTDEGLAIQIMGTDGVEWDTLRRGDLKRHKALKISIKGGTEDSEKKAQEDAKKFEVLKMVGSTNQRWRDEQMLRMAGYKEDELRRAFSNLPMASEELLSEAEQAVKDIVEGKKVALNMGANATFIDYINGRATDLDIDIDTRVALYDYSLAHQEIAAENEARAAIRMVQDMNMAAFTSNPDGATAPRTR